MYGDIHRTGLYYYIFFYFVLYIYIHLCYYFFNYLKNKFQCGCGTYGDIHRAGLQPGQSPGGERGGRVQPHAGHEEKQGQHGTDRGTPVSQNAVMLLFRFLPEFRFFISFGKNKKCSIWPKVWEFDEKIYFQFLLRHFSVASLRVAQANCVTWICMLAKNDKIGKVYWQRFKSIAWFFYMTQA